MKKTERYKWNDPGEKGVFRWIPVAQLGVDHSYQRTEVSEANTIGVSRDFSWDSFGVITVMQRADKSLWIADGQQRQLSVLRRGDLDEVPCMVFQSEGPTHEAQVFLRLNEHRSNVSAVQKFITADMAAIEPVRSAANWLRSKKLRVTSDGKSVNGITFPHVLMRSWKIDADLTKRSLDLQREIIGREALCAEIHKAIFYLERGGIDIASEAGKISMMGGKAAILRSIRTYCIETSENKNNKTCAYGLLRLINHRKRNKLSAPGSLEVA